MNGPALLALQHVDAELDQLEGRRKRLAERAALADAQRAHAAWATQRDALVTTTERAVETIAEAERSGAEIDRKRARLDAQLKTVISPREAEALMKEIEVLVSQHNGLDELELTAMEAEAEAAAALDELESIEPPLLDAIVVAQGALDDALDALAIEEGALRDRRVAAEGALDERERSYYTTTLARHGGVGFCTLERHTCSGCHVDLSQVEYEQVRREAATELPECPHCARLLVL